MAVGAEREPAQVAVGGRARVAPAVVVVALVGAVAGPPERRVRLAVGATALTEAEACGPSTGTSHSS